MFIFFQREYVIGLKTELYSGRLAYRYPKPIATFDSFDVEHVVGDEGNEKIIYCSAALGIVHDLSTNTQKTFCGHDDDITCITLSPGSLGLVATGQLGRTPHICIWDCSCLPPNTVSTFGHNYSISRSGLICRIGKGFFQRAVCSVCFSYDGKYICGIGCDDHHALGIWEVC